MGGNEKVSEQVSQQPHTHTHTHTHTQTQTHTHTCVRAQTHSLSWTHTHAHTHLHSQAAATLSLSLSCIHTQTHIHILHCTSIFLKCGRGIILKGGHGHSSEQVDQQPPSYIFSRNSVGAHFDFNAVRCWNVWGCIIYGVEIRGEVHCVLLRERCMMYLCVCIWEMWHNCMYAYCFGAVWCWNVWGVWNMMLIWCCIRCWYDVYHVDMMLHTFYLLAQFVSEENRSRILLSLTSK